MNNPFMLGRAAPRWQRRKALIKQILKPRSGGVFPFLRSPFGGLFYFRLPEPPITRLIVNSSEEPDYKQIRLVLLRLSY